MIALGKIGEEGRPAGDPKTLAARIQEFVGHSSQDVAESAVIALGALGSFESAPPLSALVKDDATGRKLVDGDRVPTRLRSFAAYGLGLIGARTHMSDVKQFVALELFSALEGIDRKKENTYDLETACIISLGLVRLPLRLVDPLEPREELPEGEAPHNSRRAQIAALLSRLENSRKTELIRAHLPVALARLSHDADLGTKRVVARELLDYLKKGKRTPLVLEQGCVTALGILGDDDKDEIDVAIRSTLLRLAKKADRSTRRLALISLAQVGARQGEGERKAFEEVRTFLLEELEKGSTQLRPWAGLALGVLEHRRALAGQSISTETKEALTQALEESSSPDEASALCIALGLARTIEAQDLLLSRTSQAQDDVVRGFACVGLGLMGARATIPRIREVAANSLRRPRLLRDSATALALLGDKNAVPELSGELREARTLAVGGAVASALSLVGDVRALRPLIEIVRAEGQPAPGTKERAFAAIALGGICDKESLPFQSKISLDVNYWLPP
ncbi:MAG: HEAT repeat domain-containing protein, partial [Planctomycetota bacterium]